MYISVQLTIIETLPSLSSINVYVKPNSSFLYTNHLSSKISKGSHLYRINFNSDLNIVIGPQSSSRKDFSC